MPQVYKEPSRTVNGPLYVVERRIRTRWSGNHPVPVSRIPLEQRTGMLHVIYVAGSLTIRNNAQTENVYPKGAHYNYDQSCDVYVEVLPRGRSEAQYDEWVKRPPYIGTWARVRRVRTRNTPLVATIEPWAFEGGTSPSTDAHLTLVSGRDIRQHLRGVLPYIGVHPSDVDTVYTYIEVSMNKGRRGLLARR